MTGGEDIHVPVFEVIDAGYTIDNDGRRLPTVVIDAGDAPEVADLARVHAVEGVGDIHTEAVRAGDLVALGIRVTVPVRAVFVIAIDLRVHRTLLDDVVEHGALLIAHTDPQRAAAEQPSSLAIDIDAPALAAQIAP